MFAKEIIITGNIGKEPKTGLSDQNVPYLQCWVAVAIDKNNTEWYFVRWSGEEAIQASHHLHKGTKVVVVGDINVRKETGPVNYGQSWYSVRVTNIVPVTGGKPGAIATLGGYCAVGSKVYKVSETEEQLWVTIRIEAEERTREATWLKVIVTDKEIIEAIKLDPIKPGYWLDVRGTVRQVESITKSSKPVMEQLKDLTLEEQVKKSREIADQVNTRSPMQYVVYASELSFEEDDDSSATEKKVARIAAEQRTEFEYSTEDLAIEQGTDSEQELAEYLASSGSETENMETLEASAKELDKKFTEQKQKIAALFTSCRIEAICEVLLENPRLAQKVQEHFSKPRTLEFYGYKNHNGQLSNFWPVTILVGQEKYSSVEHFYQAQKYDVTNPKRAALIRSAKTASEAAKLGRDKAYKPRPDWESIKDEVMLVALRAKFKQNQELKTFLLKTGNSEIVEASPNDYYWGCGAERTGKNMLGKMLMQVRKELQSK